MDILSDDLSQSSILSDIELSNSCLIFSVVGLFPNLSITSLLEFTSKIPSQAITMYLKSLILKCFTSGIQIMGCVSHFLSSFFV